ncbi:hypothetical protein M431DRAFT_490247 [Trichoderma harzianum CBS 226.95]|uniref:Copper transporter n=1 Tax=Trichoderma harzianum CBS 226.95 TaxID=983964 RepID=A0A2T4ANI1_TRIHA|nr:hypothetical protein M431DRAFT_490247 [Trichoderma harzianum CBS 226.95]PTB58634.1 hypothetical protein M431DRAFT_490247 [Trichoderma harzianum CBS 226.95]
MTRPLAAKNRECREQMSNEFHIEKQVMPISLNCLCRFIIYLVVYGTAMCITYMIF